MKFSTRFFRPFVPTATSAGSLAPGVRQASQGESVRAAEATMHDKNGATYAVRLSDRRSPAERQPVGRNFMPAKERFLQSHQHADIAAWNSILPGQRAVPKPSGGDSADRANPVATANDGFLANGIALRSSGHAPASVAATNQEAMQPIQPVQNNMLVASAAKPDSPGPASLQPAPAPATTIPVARSRR